MRTSKIKALAAFVLGFIMLNFTPVKVANTSPEVKKATCPYYIDNQICKLTVDYTIYTLPGGCTTNCASFTGVTISANTVFQLNCAGCTNICNIVVTITSIGGVAVTPGPADFTNGYSSPVPLCCGGCPSNGILYAGTPSVFKVY